MAWKGIHLSRPAYLSTERGSLLIAFRDDETPASFRVPLEDLSWIIVDTPQVSFSSSLLSRCSAAGTLVLGVDESHHPSWAALPWASFHRHGEVIRLQLDATVPQKKRLWQEIVRRKIGSQAACLSKLGRQQVNNLRALANAVKSGDESNLEARAAQLYFKHLFNGYRFVRHAEDLPNRLLNYGYSIIRAAIARNLCASGFLPQLGIHHCSQANAFNLADDLVEPFRPIVDLHVVREIPDRDPESALLKDDRRSLVALLEMEVSTPHGNVTLFHSLELAVESFKNSLRQREPSLLVFPEIET